MAFRFEKLKIWQESVKFANEIYSLTKRFPKTEQFGLTSQLQRAAVSISLNIAEGSGRNSDAEMNRFIQISIGSLFEVVTILEICIKQNYINNAEFEKLYLRCEELSKMLYGFKNNLKR